MPNAAIQRVIDAATDPMIGKEPEANLLPHRCDIESLM
jgi:hypothetical protein